MYKSRKYERCIYACKELNNTDFTLYPELPEEDMLYMEYVFSSDNSRIHIFPYVRTIPENLFVDIYIWDLTLYPKCYARYIIAPGFGYTEELEDEFIVYLKEDLLSIDAHQMSKFNKDVVFFIPELNYAPYSKQDFRMSLEHLYFASHRSGPRELLYKSGLSYIAYNLDNIPSYNLIGTTPVSIVGHELPLKLLRVLNQSELVHVLFDEVSIELSKSVYIRFSDYINGLPSLAQWNYLVALYKNGHFANHGFMKSIYDRLSISDYDSDVLELYERFLVLYDKCKTYGISHLKIPMPQDIICMINKLEKIEDCETNAYINSRIRDRKYIEDYEYSGTEYAIIMPVSMVDFFVEAISQHNCLINYDYISDHAYNKCTILFMRRKCSITKPYVTIEIINDEITQVYAKNDTLPESNVFGFLSEYAKKKGFSINYGILQLSTA